MALYVEGVVDRGMHAEETLGGSSRFEALHFALSSPHRLMRVLGAIISSQTLLMRQVSSSTGSRRPGRPCSVHARAYSIPALGY